MSAGMSCCAAAAVAMKAKGGWCQPAREKDVERLRVFNSLTNAKEEFTPALGHTVRWYTCGPTVYDVAHMGHARAYLTFDILRRVMEDYFGYEVQHQMNVTDIDDKIILRARRAALLRTRVEPEVAAGGERLAAVAARARSLLGARLEAAEKAYNELVAQPASTPPVTASPPSSATAAAAAAAIREQQREEAQKIAALKLEQARESLAAAEAAHACGNLADVVAAGTDVLADALDDEFGAEVTDHAIFAEHAQRFERSFFEDLVALGVRLPTVVTRVSEYVPEIVAYIEKIIERGLAYEANGSVYFDTRGFRARGHAYPKLCPGAGSASSAGPGADANGDGENGDSNDSDDAEDNASAALLAEGEGALAAAADEKRHASDFALWKRSKRGEPSWPSPWGGGRPGWHIECSVMASEVLGEHLDVHAGGSDLKFPHHDNEMAQAEAYYGCSQWVDYFIHAGHLHIRGLKMSKSLKNFITIRQALEANSARQLRLMMLMSQWDRPIVYSDQALDDARAKEATFRNFFGTVKALGAHDGESGGARVTRQSWRAEEKALHARLTTCRCTVRSALCDNFATSRAIAALIELVGHCNAYMNTAAQEARVPLVQEVARHVTHILRVFGVATGADDIGFPASGVDGAGDGREAVLTPVLRELVGFRDDVRSYAREHKASGLLELCDTFRDEACIGLGVRVEDRAGGARSIFKLDEPEVLRKELEVKREREREAAAKKRANKLALLEKELRKCEAAAVPVHEYFRTSDKYGSELDDAHLPTTTADGEPLSKAARKKCDSELKKHAKNRDEVEKKSGGDIQGLIESLRAQMASLSSG